VKGAVETATPAQPRARATTWVVGILVLACVVWIFSGQDRSDREPRPGGPVAGGDTGVPEGWVRERVVPIEADGGLAGQAGRAPTGVAGADGPAATAADVLVGVARRGEAATAASTRAPVDVEALHARVRGNAAAVHRDTAGQRLRLQGQLSAVEQGEPGVAVLHLALADQTETVRVVAAPSLAATALGWSLPRAVSLDCLSQGVMMGEWLLVDCRE
jgi:hypothetical protein